MELAIHTKNLSRIFGEQKAVDMINLHVPKSRIYGFLGRNGAGKTTTIRMLLGLINKTGGTILFNGLDFSNNKKQVLSRIGAMFDTPGFYENLTARENLALYMKLLGVQKKHAIEKVLNIINLKNTDKKTVRKFSTGMKQRLGLARALLHDPDILIMDEPTNGLDPAGIKEIRSLLIRLAGDHGKTLFVSSHLLSEVEQIAHKVGIIHEGKLLEEISLKDLNNRTRNCLLCKTDKPEKAAFVLEQKLKINDYEVYPEGEIHIYQDLDRAALINSTLVMSDISVSSICLSKDNLEDYFLQLTGELDGKFPSKSVTLREKETKN